MRPAPEGLLVSSPGRAESYLLRGLSAPGDAFAIAPAGASVFMSASSGGQLWRCAAPGQTS
jgi:hypothetical protein